MAFNHKLKKSALTLTDNLIIVFNRRALRVDRIKNTVYPQDSSSITALTKYNSAKNKGGNLLITVADLELNQVKKRLRDLIYSPEENCGMTWPIQRQISISHKKRLQN